MTQQVGPDPLPKEDIQCQLSYLCHLSCARSATCYFRIDQFSLQAVAASPQNKENQNFYVELVSLIGLLRSRCVPQPDEETASSELEKGETRIPLPSPVSSQLNVQSSLSCILEFLPLLQCWMFVLDCECSCWSITLQCSPTTNLASEQLVWGRIKTSPSVLMFMCVVSMKDK